MTKDEQTAAEIVEAWMAAEAADLPLADTPSLTDRVAKLLTAVREECAQIALRHVCINYAKDCSDDTNCAQAIATAIRSRKG